MIAGLFRDKIPAGEIRHIEVLKRSIDARQKNVIINLKVKIYINEPYQPEPIELPDYPDVSSAEEVLIVGVGPVTRAASSQPLWMERGVRQHVQNWVSF